MSKIILTVGPPCAGKTVWSKNYIKTNPNTIRVSRDDIMLMFKNDWIYTDSIKSIVDQMVLSGIQLGIEHELDIIVDQTNCKKQYIQEIIDMFGYQADIEFKTFDEPIEELKKRNQLRALNNHILPIKDSTIERIFKEYVILINNHPLVPIKKIK